MEQITTTEPRPPRQIDDTIPKELERICLKALSKRASERYTTATDMAEDLRLFPQTVAGSPPAVATQGVVSPPPRLDPGSHTSANHTQGILTPISPISRSSPKVCDPSMSTMPTSSWNYYRDHETGTVYLRAYDSGKIALKQPMLIRPSGWD